MSIISYAQNFEDVMLWRALKEVKNGFYIDVGANDPSEDSVTKLFYKNGWNGINIEPLASHYSALQLERDNDINLCCAAGSSTGELKLWECGTRGWATANKSVIEQHIKSGKEGKYHNVPVFTLKNICDENVTGDIHFLKIDVEGLEEDALKGNDWSIYRPWIVVVEATIPNTQIENYSEWEHILFDSNYTFAYSDGLNRFYVSDEHKELLRALKYPPNVFDGFIPHAQQQAVNQARQANECARQAAMKTQQAEMQAQQATDMLQAMHCSPSWRITAPLRWFALQTRLMIQFGFIARTKALIKKVSEPIIRHSFAFISSRPRLQHKVVTSLKFLGLHQLFLKIYFRLSGESNFIKPGLKQTHSFRPATVKQLSPQALHIYRKIEAAIAESISKNN